MLRAFTAHMAHQDFIRKETWTQMQKDPEFRTQIENAQRLLSDIYARIAAGDTKAQLLLTADALLAGLVSFSGRGLLSNVEGRALGVLEITAGVFLALLICSTVASAAMAIIVMRPRINIGLPRSMFYHEDIGKMELNEFVLTFKSMSPQEVLDDVLTQIHATSWIASAKFRWALRSSLALGVALGCGGILLVLLIFVNA